MAIINIIKDAILQNIGILKPAPKGWHKRNCPLCHTQGHGKDTRYRFGIQFNPTNIIMNCFNCSFSSVYEDGKPISQSLKIFFKNIHLDDRLIQRLDFEIFKQRNSVGSIREGDVESSLIDPEEKFRILFHRWSEMDLPANSQPITKLLEDGLDDPDFLKVANYAVSRKIYNLHEFYWSPDKDFNVNQRLIIPYYYKGKIVGFNGRLSFNATNQNIPKYYQQCPTDFVYNLDSYRDWTRKYVLLNEGVLDAWSVDGISSLGELAQTKVDIINRLQKQVIVCPDRDKKGWDLVEVAIDNNWSVAFPKWDIGIKDAAHATECYGRLLTTHSIISTAISGKDKIRIKWGLAQNARNKIRKYER